MPLDWSAQQFRDALIRYVRRRVPAHEAEDVVQSVLLEAATSPQRPADPASARRWIWGIARNKVVDHHRRARREVHGEAHEMVSAAPDDVDDMLRWAAREMPRGEGVEETLRWLLREADGETLDEIARDAKVPAPTVRQRVSRLRRHFRARHALLLAGCGLLLGLLVWWATRDALPTPPRVLPAPEIATPEAPRDAALPAHATDASADAPDVTDVPPREDRPAPRDVTDDAPRRRRRLPPSEPFSGMSSGP